MKNIFVYGSLMFDTIWNPLVQRRYRKQDAVLCGYRRVTVRGESYPGLVKSQHATVNGVLYLDVRHADIRRLDRFEGDYYQRVPVVVSNPTLGTIEASVYLFRRCYRNLLGNASWDPAHFQSHRLPRFKQQYKGFE